MTDLCILPGNQLLGFYFTINQQGHIKALFTQRDLLFLKTPAKVEISENAGYVLSCQLGEKGF